MRPRIYLVVFVAVLHAASASHADDTKQAIFHFERAEAHFKLEQYREAIREYEEAYRLSNEPTLLFNIAQAYRLAGHFHSALEHYRRLLEEIAPDHVLVPEAKERIVELEELTRTFPNQPPAEPPPLGDAKPQAPAAPAPMPSPRVSAAPPIDKPDETGLTRRQIAGIATAGAGAVSLAAAGVFGVQARRHDSALSGHTEGAWTDELLARHARGEAAERNMFVFAGLGAAAIIVGGVLYVTGRRPPRSVQIGMTLGADGSGVVMRGRF